MTLPFTLSLAWKHVMTRNGAELTLRTSDGLALGTSDGFRSPESPSLSQKNRVTDYESQKT